MSLRSSFNCPRCNRRLMAAGVVTVPGSDDELPVFQCDECIDQWEAAPGRFIPTALTFAVDLDGRALDSSTGQPLPAAPAPPKQ